MGHAVNLIKDVEEAIALLFSPVFWEDRFGRDDRFPSVVSAVFRFLCRNLHFVAPLLLAGMVVFGIIGGASIVGVLLGSILLTVWYFLLGVIGLLTLMTMEAFAKLCACLILYGELPGGAENPMDALVCFLVKGNF